MNFLEPESFFVFFVGLEVDAPAAEETPVSTDVEEITGDK